MSNDSKTLTEEELMNDQTPGEVAAVLRENARLHKDNKMMKQRVIRVWGFNVLLICLFILLALAWFSWFPKIRYIATRDNAAICEVSSTAKPNVSPEVLTEFAKDGMVASFSYDYVNYLSTITATSNKWYTEAGRKAFLKSIDESGNLERVIKGRLIMRSMATHAPQLEEEGLRGASHYWVVTVPLAIEFYVGGEGEPRSRQDFVAKVTVLQTQPSAVNPRGIGIEEMSLRPYVPRN